MEQIICIMLVADYCSDEYLSPPKYFGNEENYSDFQINSFMFALLLITWYHPLNKTNQSAPKGDVFGLGVVLMELVTGCMINAPDDIFKKGGLKDTLKYLADIEIKCR